MKFCLFVILAAVCAANAAFAAPPKPPADCGVDSDRDGWCVEDPSRTDAGGKAGYLVGAEDCNDADAAVNPGATEKVGDGIDNDCDTTTQDGKPAFDVGKFNCGGRRCRADRADDVKRVEANVAACNASTTTCQVNFTNGTFVPAWGHYIVDDDCDGVIDILDQAGKDAYDAKVRQGFRCVSVSSPSCKKGNCPPKRGKGKKPAAVVDPKLGERLGTLEETVKPLPSAVADLRNRVEGHDTLIADNADRLDGLDTALNLETAERKAADEQERRIRETNDNKLSSYIAVTAETANSARQIAGDALDLTVETRSVGFNGGLDVGMLLIGQQNIMLKGDQVARGAFAPTAYFGLHLGVELEKSIFRAFGGVGLPIEEGPFGDTEVGMLWTLGVEAMWKLAEEHSLGARVRYLDHESGGSVLGARGKSRGGGGGLVYEYAPGLGRFRFPVQVSLEILGEQIGTQGDNFEALGVGPVGLISLTFGPGLGTPRVSDMLREDDMREDE